MTFLGPGFLRCFKDPIWVPRIENRVPRFKENYHRVPRIRENGSLQDHTWHLTFSIKKPVRTIKIFDAASWY